MTEAEWFQATDPNDMLRLIGEKGGERKLRLFACACRRRVWDQLMDDDSRRVVEVAERFADGEAREAELSAAIRRCDVEHDPARTAAAAGSLRRRTSFPSSGSRQLRCVAGGRA